MNEWNVSGINITDKIGKNALLENPFPLLSYKPYKEDMMILRNNRSRWWRQSRWYRNSTNFAARAVELYVINDIPDLSKYGVGVANNGGGTDGVEFTFPAESATAGSFILIGRDSAQARDILW